MDAARPIKVAIVGGGCAGIAAAFELSRPELEHRFEVTVYQQGWRLGGKGASGRGPDGRIEEHGLHLWMGYYENAFRLLRECYEELRKARPEFWTWEQAFRPVARVGVAEQGPDTDPWSWLAYFPMNDRTPGDPGEKWQAPSVVDYFLHGIQVATTLLRSASNKAMPAPADRAARFNDPLDWLRMLGELVEEALPFAGSMLAVSLREGLALARQGLRAFPAVDPIDGPLSALLGTLQDTLSQQVERLAASDLRQRRTLEVVEVVLANLRGMVRFGLLNDARGFDAVDDYEYRDWLKLSGASDGALNSAIVRGLYNLAFAYEGGDKDRPRLSAAQALRAANRAFFTYKGALFWKMNAGMGDVVFAPFYEVLSARGVKFEFFHRLERVRMAKPDPATVKTTPHVAALDFDVQALVRGGREYRPLVEVKGLRCWPDAPDYSQLAGVEPRPPRASEAEFESFWSTRRVATKTLRVSREFDFVVLAVGLGAVPFVCSELLDMDQRWRDMVAYVRTTATRAFQVWLKPDLAALGWPHGSYDVSGIAEPFDTWADMSHLATVEDHAERPGTIAYFCSVLPDDGATPPRNAAAYPKHRNAEVQADLVRFLNESAGSFWPNARGEDGRFRWDLLATATGEAGETPDGPATALYWRANVNPSDRYTLSLPGTAHFRISPLDRTYDNLTVAGDWTDGYNIGCVEAAMMSGRLAAHALSKRPALEDIAGFDHP